LSGSDTITGTQQPDENLDNPWVNNATERGVIAIQQDILGAELLFRGADGEINEVLQNIAESESHRLAVQAPEDQGWLGRTFSGLNEGAVSISPEIGAGALGALAGPWTAAAAAGTTGGIKAGGGKIIEELRARVDITDPQAVEDLLADQATWNDIRWEAIEASGIGAGIWASLGAGGAVAGAFAKSGQVVRAGGVNMGVSAEVSAAQQLAADGTVDLGEVATSALAAGIVPVQIKGARFVPDNSGSFAGAGSRANEFDVTDYLYDESGVPAAPGDFGSSDAVVEAAEKTQGGLITAPFDTARSDVSPSPSTASDFSPANLIRGAEAGIMQLGLAR
jgi:hypothetical protein